MPGELWVSFVKQINTIIGLVLAAIVTFPSVLYPENIATHVSGRSRHTGDRLATMAGQTGSNVPPADSIGAHRNSHVLSHLWASKHYRLEA